MGLGYLKQFRKPRSRRAVRAHDSDHDHMIMRRVTVAWIHEDFSWTQVHGRSWEQTRPFQGLGLVTEGVPVALARKHRNRRAETYCLTDTLGL